MKPSPSLADPVRRRDATVVEEDLAGGRAFDPELRLDAADLETGRVRLDHEARNAVVAGRRVGLRENRVEVRDARVRDEALRAVEDVLVALALRLRSHRGGIRAGAGLGERVRRNPLPARDLRQKTVLLLLRARKPKRERAELLHGEDEPDGRICLGDLLHGDEEHQRPGVRATVPLVEGEPEDLVLAQKLDHVPGEVAGLVDLGCPGRDALPRQRADELADPTLLLGKGVPRHAWILGAVALPEPRVQVVVVVPQHLNDSRRACQPRVRADEDDDGARRDEAVDEILGKPVVDLGGTRGGRSRRSRRG